MKFYLPYSDDCIDPKYDFINETYAPERAQKGRLNHDWYAHQFFSEPVFDGMLVSKSIINATMERRVREAGGLYAFYRLAKSVPTIGDCGAFSYLNETEPPYGITEILDYYETLGFTYGVALDHLVFASMPMAERERRLVITLENAQAFITQHQANGYQFVPVGVAQGWDPISRRQAIEQLQGMGYQHLAVGGVVRSSDKDIRSTLEAIHPILAHGTSLHLFGVARMSILPDLIRLGVTSADSASPIRRAFLGTNADNYWTVGGQRYAAIRVPEAKDGISQKRSIDSLYEVQRRNGISLDSIRQMEQKTLKLLRDFEQERANLEETLTAVLQYERLYGDRKRSQSKSYVNTLLDRPWRSCPCPICNQWGIEVILFRGHNRHRRRGFHNVYVFYQQMKKLVGIQ